MKTVDIRIGRPEMVRETFTSRRFDEGLRHFDLLLGSVDSQIAAAAW